MRIIYSRRFKKAIRKLPIKVRESFKERAMMFIQNSRNPLLRDHGLTGNFSGLRAFSVTGDYRVIYKKLESHTYLFGEIGTHNQVYE